jgi:dipeptidyl-peptidase 4
MKSIRILPILILLPFFSIAQIKKLTVEDAVLKQRTTLAPEKLIQPSWIPGTNFFTYIIKSKSSEYLVKEDATSLKIDTLLTLDVFKEALYTAKPDVPKVQHFTAFTWVDEKNMRLFFEHAYYTYNIEKNIISLLLKVPTDAEDFDYEPVSNRCTFTFGNNLAVTDKESLKEDSRKGNDNVKMKKEMLSSDGNYGITNGKAVHRNEFGINKGTFWSPKGSRIAYYKLYEGMVADYPILDFEQTPVVSKNIKYPMAGNTSHQAVIYVKDFSKDRQYMLQTGLGTEQYLTNITWSPSEENIYVAIVNREQNEMKLNSYDGTTGVFVKTLFTESHAKYVEPEKPMIFVPNKPAQFLWFSKRDGFNHLYLYDVRGKLIKQVTKGSYDVTDFLGFDKSGTLVFYSAATENGLERQIFSVDLTTGKVIAITHNPGMHTAMFNDDGNYFIDTYSNTSTPKRSTLMDKSGAEISILVNGQNPLLNYEKCGIKLFDISSTDKKVKLNCRIWFPPQFDSTKKYPVLVYLYGGPHAQMVTNSWLGGGDMWLNYMAQQGFIVFTLDNRGSMNRGIEFENVTFRNLGKIEREDQLAGVDFLKHQSFVDSTRLGVFGWSFGGFMSIGMMTRTNAFKVGVAGGPVIDWKMYEVMYTERYMDKPQENKAGYDDANLLNYVKNLKGKLMVIHGTSDDVVVWQHSIDYIKKCVDEGVQVDYFVYPGHKHNVSGKDRVHLMQKVADYFKQNL